MIKRRARKLYQQLIQPLSVHPDEQRREYLFNVLVALFVGAACITTLSSAITHWYGAVHATNSVPLVLGFLVFMLGLWMLSRKGHFKFSAVILVVVVWLASFELAVAWSFELPIVQLMSALVIVIAGILLSSRVALLVTAISVVSVLVLGYFQVYGLIPVNTSWLTSPLEYSDTIGFAVILIITGAVSWLANNEIDSLLKRAWRSESALQKERDELEATLAKRTVELEEAQLDKVLELQNLAELGRISTSLLHDIANPITAASLTLQQGEGAALIDQARGSLQQLERYVDAARKQLGGQPRKVSFEVNAEVQEVLGLLEHYAMKFRVHLSFRGTIEAHIHGDQVAFHRSLANLIVNAIESYVDSSNKDHNKVIVSLAVDSNLVGIQVQDFGKGIKPRDLPHIFKDFYSTKHQVHRGLGIGLSSVRRVIEHDFKGKITVQSRPEQGTLFEMEIPLLEAKSTKRPGVPRKPAK